MWSAFMPMPMGSGNSTGPISCAQPYSGWRSAGRIVSRRRSTRRCVVTSRSIASVIGTSPSRTSMPSTHSNSSPASTPTWEAEPPAATSVTRLASSTPMPIGRGSVMVY